MRTLNLKSDWNQSPVEEFWKKINDLIPHAKENVSSFDNELAKERAFLEEFISDYQEKSHNQHYLSAIDDLEKFGYIGGSQDNSEALLLKSIIAVADKKQRRPLWEVLHMIIFNKASYKNFFDIYLPIPTRIRCFLGSIIARLENQQKAIKQDRRLKAIWKEPEVIW